MSKAVKKIGKAFKKIVKVIAPIVISIAIPKLAPMMFGKLTGGAILSKAVTTLGTAATGAAMGAVGAKVVGADPRMGALMGGIGGGVAGFQGYSPTAGAGTPQVEIASRSGLPGITGGAGAASAGLSGLTGAAGTAGTAGTPSAAFGNIATSATGATGVTTGAAGTAGTAAPGFFAQAGQAVTSGVADVLKTIPTALANSFTNDPARQADMLLRAAGQLAGSQLAGDGLTDPERQLLEAQVADLQQIREQDEELFRTRVESAMSFLGEAKYFDPEYFGLRAQREVQIAGAQQMREAERAAALTPGRGGLSAADVRRGGLDITARGQSAYLRGAESAQQQRLQAYDQGLAQLPREAPSRTMGLSQDIAAQYAEAEKRRREIAGDIGDFFGSLTGTRQATSIG